jgi:hypothetical protein
MNQYSTAVTRRSCRDCRPVSAVYQSRQSHTLTRPVPKQGTTCSPNVVSTTLHTRTSSPALVVQPVAGGASRGTIPGLSTCYARRSRLSSRANRTSSPVIARAFAPETRAAEALWANRWASRAECCGRTANRRAVCRPSPLVEITGARCLRANRDSDHSRNSEGPETFQKLFQIEHHGGQGFLLTNSLNSRMIVVRVSGGPEAPTLVDISEALGPRSLMQNCPSTANSCPARTLKHDRALQEALRDARTRSMDGLPVPDQAFRAALVALKSVLEGGCAQCVRNAVIWLANDCGFPPNRTVQLVVIEYLLAGVRETVH